MKNRTRTVTLMVLVVSICLVDGFAAAGPGRISVIPKPMETKHTGGHFTIKDKTAIYFQGDSAGAKTVAEYLSETLRPATGLSLVVLEQSKAKPPLDSFLLTTENSDCGLANEGYELTVTENGVVLRAPNQAGLFYGVQTIRHLLPAQIESQKKVLSTCWKIPCVQFRQSPFRAN